MAIKLQGLRCATIQKSKKLDDVCYDIRGPCLKSAANGRGRAQDHQAE